MSGKKLAARACARGSRADPRLTRCSLASYTRAAPSPASRQNPPGRFSQVIVLQPAGSSMYVKLDVVRFSAGAAPQNVSKDPAGMASTEARVRAHGSARVRALR